MKHLILIFALSFSVLLNAGGVSFVQYLENNAILYPFDGTEPENIGAGYPIYPGDKIKTQRNTFVEIALSDGNLLWIGAFSELELRAISGTEGYPDKRTYLFLNEGEISYEAIGTPVYNEEPVIGFKNGDLYILSSGVYYVGLERGNVKILIIEGKAEVATSEGSVYLRSGEEATVFYDGLVDRKRLSLKNEFFVEMVENRRALRMRSQSSQYTGRQFSTVNYMLDSYGSWIYQPEFSLYVWRPTVVVGWSPYYHGYWRWTLHGWFWVSYEPWGYITYHYGRWVWTPQYGWVWVPGYTWSPAWVYWFWFDNYFAWCPMGYYDYWWYYRWDWWWSWPPCWYNDCYFGFKGRVNLKHLHRDFWIYADGRNLGKTDLQIHKGLKTDFKDKEGLIFAINPPVNLKDVSKLNEHYLSQKNLIKNDLTSVFKLTEKPTIEAKNILSETKNTVSKEKNFLKVDREDLGRSKIFEDLKPARGIVPNQNFNKDLNKGTIQPRQLERKEINNNKITSPKRNEMPTYEKEKPKNEQGREPVKIYQPSRDVTQPKQIENKNENQLNNYNYKNNPTPNRQPVYNYEYKRYETKEYSPTNVQPQYNRNQYYQTPQNNTKTYSAPTFEKQNNSSSSYSQGKSTPTKSNSPSPSQSPSRSQSPSPSPSFSTPSPSSPSNTSSSSHSSPSSSSSSSSHSSIKK